MTNVMLKPMTMSQNVHLPNDSDIMRPLIFGNQYWMAPKTAKTMAPTATK